LAQAEVHSETPDGTIVRREDEKMRKEFAERILAIVCGLSVASGIAFPRGELAESIIVVLDEDSRDYQDAVFNRLTPKVETLQAALAETLSIVRGAWESHHHHPSLETSLAYEEAVCEGLHAINKCFGAILEEEAAFEAASNALGDCLEKLTESMDTKIASSTTSASLESDEAASHEKELVDLANRYRDHLKTGRMLPQEINDAVISLEVQHLANRQRSELRAGHTLKMEEWKESVKTLSNGFRECTSRWRNVFDRVCEDQETLAVLVDIQADEAEIAAAVQRVSGVVGQLRETESSLAELRGSFDRVVQTMRDTDSNPSANLTPHSEGTSETDQEGVKILTGYLDREGEVSW